MSTISYSAFVDEVHQIKLAQLEKDAFVSKAVGFVKKMMPRSPRTTVPATPAAGRAAGGLGTAPTVRHVQRTREKFQSYVKPEHLAAQQGHIAEMQRKARTLRPVRVSRPSGPVPLGKREHAITPDIQRQARTYAHLRKAVQTTREAA